MATSRRSRKTRANRLSRANRNPAGTAPIDLLPPRADRSDHRLAHLTKRAPSPIDNSPRNPYRSIVHCTDPGHHPSIYARHVHGQRFRYGICWHVDWSKGVPALQQPVPLSILGAQIISTGCYIAAFGTSFLGGVLRGIFSNERSQPRPHHTSLPGGNQAEIRPSVPEKHVQAMRSSPYPSHGRNQHFG
jgi:hypothetical protein